MPLLADVNEKVPAAVAQVVEFGSESARSVLNEHYCISVINATHVPESAFILLEFPTSRVKPLSEVTPVTERTAGAFDFADYVVPLRVHAEYGVRVIAADLPILPWEE
ncbi:MAG: hypothetical protein ACREMM_13030 [Gemmatimonadales bacterium]